MTGSRLRGRRGLPGADHVVVVGAGLAGLSAAMRLAGAGRRVTLLEREAVPGGRAGLATVTTDAGEYRFDTGPTVLTMPELIEDCFDALGESMDDWLTLEPVHPLYRARYADGTHLDVVPDRDEMAAAIAALCGGDEAAGYERYVDFVTELYRYEMRDFIDRNLDRPTDLLTGSLAHLVAAGGMRRLAPTVARYLNDDRLQRIFSFQSLYAGVAPTQALAIYAVIAYMDSVAGVFFPRGGLHALPTAMAAAAEKHGVDVRLGTEVARIEHSGGRASAVVTTGGERVACDALVLTPDLPVARRDLLGDPLTRRLTYSPSCWLLTGGSTVQHPEPGPPAHHTISFGQAWDQTFAELTTGRLMSDPSLLITQPTVGDATLAPDGRHIYSVLAPTPHLGAGVPGPDGLPLIDWERTAPLYRRHVMGVLAARGYPDLAESLEVELVTTPLDWQALGMEQGTPFALAHTFRQTGPFRPGNTWGQNVTFAGSGTTPGVGVPMVLISGRLAAERIVGVDPAYHSRAWP